MENYFTREQHSDVVVELIDLSRATLNEAEHLKGALMKDIMEGFLKFVVDLKHCEFMDSTFLSTLVTTLKHLHSKGGNLKLSSVNKDIQSLLELTGTIKVFEIFDTKLKAVKSFS